MSPARRQPHPTAAPPNPRPWPGPDQLTGLGPATPAVAAILHTAATLPRAVIALMTTAHLYPERHRDSLHELNAAWAWAERTHRAQPLRATLEETFDAAVQHGWNPVIDTTLAASPAATLYQALLGAAISDVAPALARRLNRRWDDAMPPPHLTDPTHVALWCQLRHTTDRATAAATVAAVLARPP